MCTNFKKVNIVPSSSCQKVANPTPYIRNCAQACVDIGSSLYMVSQHALAKKRICCQLPLLSDTEHIAGEWRSFVREYNTKSLHQKLDSNNISLFLKVFDPKLDHSEANAIKGVFVKVKLRTTYWKHVKYTCEHQIRSTLFCSSLKLYI